MNKHTIDDRPALTVVIPFYNEQDNVVPLLTEIDDALASIMDYELVAVDDGSTDGTAAALAAAMRSFRTMRVLRLPRNRGQSAALVNGIHAARTPLIATLDGDGQNPPIEIPFLVRTYHAAASGNQTKPLLVVGWRQQRNDGGLRGLSSGIANNVRSQLLGDDCPDTGCALKVFAREDFLRLPLFRHMHRFLPALFVRDGGRVLSVPVSYRPRRSGRSKYGGHNRFWTELLDLAGMCWLLRRACRIDCEVDDA